MLWKYAQISRLGSSSAPLPEPFRVPQALADGGHPSVLMPAVLSSLIHYAWGWRLGTVS